MSEADFRKRAVYAAMDDERGWDCDEFEDQIAATVVGLYEKPCLPSNAPAYPVQFTGEELARVREHGAYVSHPSRVFFADELDAPVDKIYKGLAVHSLIARGHEAGQEYRSFYVLKRAPSIPKPLYAVGPGAPFAFVILAAWPDGRLEALKQYFTADGKNIYPAAFDLGKTKRYPYVTMNKLLGETHADVLKKLATSTFNSIADQMHTWAIASNDSGVRVEVGCYHEEVKSLLYARSLPMTATGRKRPILHLVAAHRRRIKEGVEIDIEQFLRGVRKVEMGGAIFEVRSPEPLPAKRVPNTELTGAPR